MSIIKVRNHSGMTDAEALRAVANVVDSGRISADGTSYCYATRVRWPKDVFVIAVANKDSDRFDVRDWPDPFDGEDSQ